MGSGWDNGSRRHASICLSDSCPRLVLRTEKNGLSFIETSALDSTNVETAFHNVLTGESMRPELGNLPLPPFSLWALCRGDGGGCGQGSPKMGEAGAWWAGVQASSTPRERQLSG